MVVFRSGSWLGPEGSFLWRRGWVGWGGGVSAVCQCAAAADAKVLLLQYTASLHRSRGVCAHMWHAGSKRVLTQAAA